MKLFEVKYRENRCKNFSHFYHVTSNVVATDASEINLSKKARKIEIAEAGDAPNDWSMWIPCSINIEVEDDLTYQYTTRIESPGAAKKWVQDKMDAHKSELCFVDIFIGNFEILNLDHEAVEVA